jgi:predicted ArsR family transcriptional regulator
LKIESFLHDPGENVVGKHQRPGAAASTQITSAWLAVPTTGTDRLKVLAEIVSRGERGATDDEMQVALGMNPSTQRPRRVELVERGWLFESEEKRATRSGRPAAVWKLTNEAKEKLRGHR